LLLAVTCVLPREPRPRGPDPATAARNTRYGFPAEARADPSWREAYLISRLQYTLSYNAKTRTPNWVSWQLCKDDIGKAQRGPFEPDPLLPPESPR
jgi:endonuclease G